MKKNVCIFLMASACLQTNTHASSYPSVEFTPPTPTPIASIEGFQGAVVGVKGLDHTYNGWNFKQISPSSISQMAALDAFSYFWITLVSDIGWMFNINNSGVLDSPNLGTFDYRVAKADHSAFKLSSIEADMGAYDAANGYNFIATVTGYKNEMAVISEEVDFSITDTEGTIEYLKYNVDAAKAGVLNFNEAWQNIDEIRFTGGTSNTTSALMLDDITTLPAVETTSQPVLSHATPINNVLCNGDSTGSALLEITGGNPNYSYVVSNGVTGNTSSSTISLLNLPADSYQVIVTDNNNFKDTLGFTITEPTALYASGIITNNVGCNGVGYGSILMSVYGGTAPYTYLWNNGAINGFETNLTSGTYSITVTDANGCTATTSVTLQERTSSSSTQTVSAEGSFEWINGITYTESTNVPTYTLPNAAGCDSVITLNLTITEPTELDYCPSRSTRNRFEWIKSITIDNHSNTSGANGSGFGDYTDQIIQLDTGEVVTVELIPGYRRRVYEEFWRIWADWNADGDFNDAGEKVFEQKGKNIQTGTFTVPVNVTPNQVELRVSMRWKQYAPACGNFRNGEVEQYAIKVDDGQGYALDNTFDRLAYEDYQTPTENISEFVDVYPTLVSQGDYITGYLRVNQPGIKQFTITNTLGQQVKTFTVHCTEEENRVEISTEGLSKGMYLVKEHTSSEAIKIVVN